ncbi:hypothetical protein [Micromonospora sp. ATCC 39149]|uniref:hypothetical protein n=1 Tax=Micromonospora sp. (strain ATCC 39149 / NRRL 15099 / SCC 1413) TaxID=219305 RepID=UPI001E2E80B1|nr:hypothetical protein [Micromonospora sp. ATCC 39149]
MSVAVDPATAATSTGPNASPGRATSALIAWVLARPTVAVLLGIDADRRPSEAMIRRLLQAIDPDLLTTAIGIWLAARIPAPAPGSRRAIAVDGKTLRGSRTRDSAARHVLAAADQHTGIVLASTDVDTKTNEITRFTASGSHADLLSSRCIRSGVVSPAASARASRSCSPAATATRSGSSASAGAAPPARTGARTAPTDHPEPPASPRCHR